MKRQKLHADEFEIDERLVQQLVGRQFPQWAGLPITEVGGGTANAIYRLGDSLSVRLPRTPWTAWPVSGLADYHACLVRLAPSLPVTIPTPVALGTPDLGYPSAWAVHRWLEGAPAYPPALTGLSQVADELADFLLALWRIDTAGGKAAWRQAPLTNPDPQVETALLALDPDAAAGAWEASVSVPEWDRPPVWTHTDLLAGNLLHQGGRLSAVIDFEICGLGDPALDLIPAWGLLDRATRPRFRERLGVDDATWLRGRGWALAAVGGIAHYRQTLPAFAAMCERMVTEALADYRDV